MLQVLSRQELGRGAWDQFVEGSHEAWLWHRFDFQDALTTWPVYTDASFALTSGPAREVLAVLPLQLVGHRYGPFRWYELNSLGGPAWQPNLTNAQRTKLGRVIIERVADAALRRRAVDARLCVAPMAPAYRGEQCPRVNPLLDWGANDVGQTWVLSLTQDPCKTWQEMEGRARTAIRKATRADVHVRPAEARDLDSYYDLHCQTYARTGVIPHPRSYFEAIWRDFLPAGLALILMAEERGESVAAANFGLYKGAAHYWTGAANLRGLEVEANSLLQWTAIKWMAEHGVQWYDTGEAFSGAAAAKLKHLSDFKKSFGGQLYPLYRTTLDTSLRPHRVLASLKGVLNALR